MNTIKKVAGSTKKFVVRHRTPLAVVITAAVMHTIAKKGFEQHNDFLKDHDLFEKFYEQVN